MHVVDRSDEAREELVLARAELEAVTDGLVGRGPHLVRPPAPQQLLPAEGDPMCGPKYLYGEQTSTSQPHADTSIGPCGP